jgi:peptidoglycan/LPS O-acetylase OafA/YrhL
MYTPKSIAEKTVYDPAIDGLRGIAILLVVLNHANVCALQDPTRSFRFPFLAELGKGGAGGVSLFFILSALTLMNSTRARFAREQLPRISFYIRRAFRILPIWWIFIFVSVIARNAPTSVILPHLFMYFGFQDDPSFTHVGWSLFVEETFYLFFPLIFPAILRPMGAMVFLITMLLCSGRIIPFDLDSHLPESLHFLSHIPFYHYATFALGIVCFHLTKGSYSRFKEYLGRLPKLCLDLIAMTLFGLSLISQPHGNFQIAACFIVVLIGMMKGTVTRRILSTTILRTFGICCYSIYLFHGLFLYWLRYTDLFSSLGQAPFSPDVQLAVASLAAGIVCYLFGIFSFKYFEKPCVDIGKSAVRKLALSSSEKAILFSG